MRIISLAAILIGAMVCSPLLIWSADAETADVYNATLADPKQQTKDISTAELRKILAEKSAVVLDSRPKEEFVGGHIPGATHIDASPKDMPAAIERLVKNDKAKALVLYCNGPYCSASKRLANALVKAGFTNVRRYQLGMPIWRALGGPTEIELEGIVRVVKLDKTVVYLDARSAEDFAKGSILGAANISPDKLKSGGPKGKPMPLDDFNRRVIIFGSDFKQARALADVLSKRPWHNVMYFPGTYETLKAALASK